MKDRKMMKDGEADNEKVDAAPVKGEAAKTEVVKAGGDMAMPTSVTITLKTRLTGTVNVYYCSDDTGKYTLLASPVAKDGSITFATRQLGHLVLTTTGATI